MHLGSFLYQFIMIRSVNIYFAYGRWGALAAAGAHGVHFLHGDVAGITSNGVCCRASRAPSSSTVPTAPRASRGDPAAADLATASSGEVERGGSGGV